MSVTRDPLDLAVPRNQTVLMQHLQLLVGREEHRGWCGGFVERHKLPGFLEKLAVRYPITRNSRERSYDRKRGLAVVHFIAYPAGDRAQWWLLSDAGKGGLADATSPDARVAHDAMAGEHHLTVDDYVLLYATKKEAHTVRDRRSGRERVIFKDTSTWTWKLRSDVVSGIRAAIDECCARLDYGHEGDDTIRPWGLRGLLATQRRRPLFSGVRNQVIELHRYARDRWDARRPLWLTRYPALAKQYGVRAGALRPLNEVVTRYLPKMRRLPVYGPKPTRLRDLVESVGEAGRPAQLGPRATRYPTDNSPLGSSIAFGPGAGDSCHPAD